MAGGLLINKPAKNYLNYAEAAVKKAADAIGEVSGNKRNKTATALQFVLQQPAITSAIVGIRNMQQLEDAVQAIDAAPLEKNEMEALRRAVPLNYYKEHR